MLACVLFCAKMENRIWVEERSLGGWGPPCTLPPTPHTPHPTISHTHPAPSHPIAIWQSIRKGCNLGSWGTRNEWQIEIWVTKRMRREGAKFRVSYANKCFLRIVYNWCWNTATKYTSPQILWIRSEQRSPQRVRTPNVFNPPSIAQYKKPCGRKRSSANILPNRAVKAVVVVVRLNAAVSIARNMGDASPRSVGVPCSRSNRRYSALCTHLTNIPTLLTFEFR